MKDLLAPEITHPRLDVTVVIDDPQLSYSGMDNENLYLASKIGVDLLMVEPNNKL